MILDFTDCPPIVREFLNYMRTIRGRSERTVEAYHIDLRFFMRYLKLHNHTDNCLGETEFNKISIEELPLDIIRSVTLADVYEFLNYTAENGNSSKTRARKVSALRSFYHYLTTRVPPVVSINPLKDLPLPSIRQTMPRYLSLEESRELLSNLPQSKNYERDFCMITFFLNCGMRLSELCGINIGDIKGNTLRLLGKGNKERIVYLNESCIGALDQYKKVRKISPSEPQALFLSSRGTRITPRRVEQIVEAGLKACMLDGRGYSPHKLRHTAATLMYQEGGVDVRVLQEILGHANLGTTQIYTHVSSHQIENAAFCSPLAKDPVISKKSVLPPEEEIPEVPKRPRGRPRKN